MGKIVVMWLLLLATAIPLAAKTRRIHFLQDDAQSFIVSKVYELQHIAANDLAPYVLTAVIRYDDRSKVDRMRYLVGKKEFLMVSTPVDMMPYVDEMVAAMDRPSTVVDRSGSIVNGTGMSRLTYLPRHRSSDEMVNIANEAISWNGMVFRDPVSNLIYWKDTCFVSELIGLWMRLFDRPLPQVELVFKLYQVRKSDLRDIGVDYLSWKNGPGLNMFAAGLQSTVFGTQEKGLSAMGQVSSWSFGGTYFAPQFDASFIRMLSQQGTARMLSTASEVLHNDPEGQCRVSFTPDNQNIRKDEDGRTAVVSGSGENTTITVSAPVICFRRTGETDMTYRGEESDFTVYGPSGGNIRFDYELTIGRVPERNNLGIELTEQGNFQSTVTIDLGMEHPLAVCDKRQKVSQTVGVPFLSSIPILKYLFSTTETVEEQNELFVTVSARSLRPEEKIAGWAGKPVPPEIIMAGDKRK